MKGKIKLTGMNEAYYVDNNITLYHGDCLELLKKIPRESITTIFADPPYNLSNGGITCKAGKMVSVNKATGINLKA